MEPFDAIALEPLAFIHTNRVCGARVRVGIRALIRVAIFLAFAVFHMISGVAFAFISLAEVVARRIRRAGIRVLVSALIRIAIFDALIAFLVISFVAIALKSVAQILALGVHRARTSSRPHGVGVSTLIDITVFRTSFTVARIASIAFA